MTGFDLDAYCRRIAYAGARAPTEQVLRAVTQAQAQAIAFENIAIAAGGVPDVAPQAVLAKLAHAGRGGYCHELNTLLLGALSAIGFSCRVISARVRYRVPAEVDTARAHMALVVELGSEMFLADAGFGGLTLTAPIRLRPGRVQATPHEAMRVLWQGGDFMLQAKLGEGWTDVYSFDLAPHNAADIAQQNWFAATRPAGLFARTVIATRPVVGGRWSLMNTLLTWRPTGRAAERHELDQPRFAAALRDVFALEWDAGTITAAYAVAARREAMLDGFM